MPDLSPESVAPGTAPCSLTAAEFRRRFRWLIVHSWIIPPVFVLGFILLIGVLTPEQIHGILVTPIEPAYIFGWLAFAVWFLPRAMRPLSDWLDGATSPEPAVHAVRRFPLIFWATFLIYLAVAPASVIVAAERYTGFIATPNDWFRIELVALIVSIIVGLPIFFLIFDLFGQALGGIVLRRPIVTVRTKVFLIGALVPLLIGTLLVQYYWTRTGYFTFETFGVWLLLEVLAIAGSLMFARSFGRSLGPLQRLIGTPRPLLESSVAALQPRSTDELGLLTAGYRALLDELRLHSEILELNNRLLRSAGEETSTARVFTAVVDLCRQAMGADQAFLMVHDPASNCLLGVAQTGSDYRPEGHYCLALDDQSMAVWAFTHGETVAIADAQSDPRVSQSLRAHFGIQSAMATPLQAGATTVGVLMVAHTAGAHVYGARDMTLIEGLAREAAFALHTQRLHQDREQTESALREQAEQVRLLMDATEEGIYGVDRDGLCTFINPAALRMLGYRQAADLLGRNLHALIHHTFPDGRPYPKEECRVRLASLAGETTHADDEVHWRADGTSFPVEYWSRPIVRDGRVVGTVVSFVDITARKQAEQALRRHNRMLHVVASTTEILVRERSEQEFMTDICRLLVEEGRFRMAWIGMIEADGVRVRPVAEAGVDEGYLAQADIRCDDTPQGQGPTGRALRTGRTVINDDTETNARFAPWRERARAQGYRSSIATPIRRHGMVTGALNVYSAEPNAFEANEVVLIEKLAADLGHAMERHAAEAARQRSEQRLRTILATEPECVKILAADGSLLEMNPAGLAMIEAGSLAEVQGHLVANIVVPEHRAAFLDLTRRVTRRGESGQLQFEIVGLHGTRRWLETHAVPLRDEATGETRLLGLTRDITERKRQETQIRQLNVELEQRVRDRTAQLEQANKELESFCYSVSHDLRAPLRAIDGFAQALRDDFAHQIDDVGQGYLDRVVGGARRMGLLIDDLLELSRASRAPLQPGEVDLSAIAGEVVSQLTAAEPARRVVVDITPGMRAHGDPRLLQIALTNLLENAWKYTGKTDAARIRFGLEQVAGRNVYCVRDNGVGFDMQYAGKLFGAFQRLHGAEFPGTGIGLATVQRIITRHGGRVWAEAQLGKGAAFFFTIGEG